MIGEVVHMPEETKSAAAPEAEAAAKNVFEKTYEIPSAVEEFRRLYQEVKEQYQWGDMVEVYGALNASDRERNDLFDEIQQSVDEVGAYVETQILVASMPGYSWLKEYMIPRFRGLSPKKLIIQTRPFEDWELAHKPVKPAPRRPRRGAPVVEEVEEEDPSKEWADPWDRFEAELDGIAEEISAAIKLDPEKILFEEYDGNIYWDIVCLTESPKGTRASVGSFREIYAERPYLDAFPEMGLVHPSTGYIQVYNNNDTLLEQTIKEDTEYVRDAFIAEILPELGKALAEKVGYKAEGEDAAETAVKNPGVELCLDLALYTPDRGGTEGDLHYVGYQNLTKELVQIAEDYLDQLRVNLPKGALEEAGIIKSKISEKEGTAKFKAVLTVC